MIKKKLLQWVEAASFLLSHCAGLVIGARAPMFRSAASGGEGIINLFYESFSNIHVKIRCGELLTKFKISLFSLLQRGINAVFVIQPVLKIILQKQRDRGIDSH